jgi:hypothetical protein
MVEEVEQSAYDTPDDWKKELRVRRGDLGVKPGMMVQGSKLLCVGTGIARLGFFAKPTTNGCRRSQQFFWMQLREDEA